MADSEKIITQITRKNALLRALWHEEDPAVFAGVDPLGRVVLYNSPSAVDLTLLELWRELKGE
ncbi:MAG: hypothetical protein U5N86_08270 [Planctomycetota bacterium]|nr:hypothetical protein [Planctomycetota bacterium]